MPNETNELAKSEAMINFYRTLAAVQTNAIFRIMSGNNAAEMTARAEEETERLMKAMRNPKCERGQVWNEITQQCE